MIALGCDHAGVQLKASDRRAADLARASSTATTAPTTRPRATTRTTPRRSARRSCAGEAERGILICGTGVGISIAANKVEGVRAALCADTFTARMSREHNDSNVLCLGARVVGVGLALDIVAAWLDARVRGRATPAPRRQDPRAGGRGCSIASSATSARERLLEAAIRGRRPSHAYLLTGPEGVGKATLARAFAQALNCAGPARRAALRRLRLLPPASRPATTPTSGRSTGRAARPTSGARARRRTSRSRRCGGCSTTRR